METFIKQKETANGLVKQVHDESWSQFIGSIDHDVHGKQFVGYKILKGMNKNENYTANLSIIPEHKWIVHYKALWSNYSVKAKHSNIEPNNCYL